MKMKMAICAAALCLAGSAQAERRVYAGTELEALVCAHLFVISYAEMENRGYVSTGDRELAMLWAQRILIRYVSGNDDQKLAALKTVAGRRSKFGTLVEFTQRSKRCLQRFPI